VTGIAAVDRVGHSTTEVQSNMIFVSGGDFRMGSESYYPEEAPVHCVTVDDFWMDRTPVTNRQFKELVESTGYVTFAEVTPDPKEYPGAAGHAVCRFAGVLATFASG
jgi:formylglycine-generating enzyme required for sulfatase activity